MWDHWWLLFKIMRITPWFGLSFWAFFIDFATMDRTDEVFLYLAFFQLFDFFEEVFIHLAFVF
jgi:hypothetical protein